MTNNLKMWLRDEKNPDKLVPYNLGETNATHKAASVLAAKTGLVSDSNINELTKALDGVVSAKVDGNFTHPKLNGSQPIPLQHASSGVKGGEGFTIIGHWLTEATGSVFYVLAVAKHYTNNSYKVGFCPLPDITWYNLDRPKKTDPLLH